jgi:hypothetical protein
LVEGISEKYHGSTSGSRLEAALTGTMADKLTAPPERERPDLAEHVAGGEDYDIAPCRLPTLA